MIITFIIISLPSLLYHICLQIMEHQVNQYCIETIGISYSKRKLLWPRHCILNPSNPNKLFKNKSSLFTKSVRDFEH